MKKILSLFLTAILILSSMCVASAKTVEQNEAEQLCSEKFADYIKNSPAYYPDDNLPVSIDFIGEINGYYVCYGEYGIIIPWELSYNLDGYLFKTNNEYDYIDGEIKLPILFINENECLSFSEAYDRGIFTADSLAELIDSGSQTKQVVSYLRIGDVDKNGIINILDATAIQKHLANLETFDSSEIELADVNSDGVINILDATEIQKYSANLISKLG